MNNLYDILELLTRCVQNNQGRASITYTCTRWLESADIMTTDEHKRLTHSMQASALVANIRAKQRMAPALKQSGYADDIRPTFMLKLDSSWAWTRKYVPLQKGFHFSLKCLEKGLIMSVNIFVYIRNLLHFFLHLLFFSPSFFFSDCCKSVTFLHYFRIFVWDKKY